MLQIKVFLKKLIDEDRFKIGAAGVNKVRNINKLFLIGAATFSIIVVFYLILNLTTNYYKLGSFEDYVVEYKDNVYPSKFKQINFGIKIMPSFNLEDNILFMEKSKEVSIINNILLI